MPHTEIYNLRLINEKTTILAINCGKTIIYNDNWAPFSLASMFLLAVSQETNLEIGG